MKETNDVRLVQKNAKEYFEIKIENKIHDEIGEKLDSFLLEHKRIYLEANPSYGKTYHIVQIGRAIKEGKSPFKRLIFCTPRLIIQKQFKSYNIGVDFVLDGESNMKKFKSEHQIVTSTFNSLHRIPGGIKSTDLVVIDEAHIMLTNYNSYNKASKNPYYEKLLQTLYNSDSFLILMSGTPTINLNELLKLKHLKVIKENEDVTYINVGHNHNVDTKELSYRYCQKYAEEFPDRLNVVYIKNVNDCSEIALHLVEKGLNAKVLTSKTKQGDVYLKIVEEDLIPNDVQFIITTNVLSVGTNINNENIGGVVMFNENDPLEIKQFAKRFRKAKNLNIDVVNKVTKSFNEKSSIKRRTEILEQSKTNVKITLEQIKCQRDLLNDYSDSSWNNFKNISFDKSDFGTPKGVINDALKRFLINESYLYDRLIETFDSPVLLEEAFSQLGYNDINAKVSDLDKKLWEDHEKSLDKEAKNDFKNKYDSIIDDFISKKDNYCYYAQKVLSYMDYNKKERFLEMFKSSFDLLGLENNIEEKLPQVNGILFKQYILDPLIEYFPYFNDLQLCLKFLKSVKAKERNRHILSLYVNKLFLRYCDLDSFKAITYKKGAGLFQKGLEKEKKMIDLIIESYHYLGSCHGLHIDDFRNYLMENKKAMGIIKSSNKEAYPFDMISENNYPSLGFLLGIANGLFVIETKRVKIKDTKGKLRKGYKFETNSNGKKIISSVGSLNNF